MGCVGGSRFSSMIGKLLLMVVTGAGGEVWRVDVRTFPDLKKSEVGAESEI